MCHGIGTPQVHLLDHGDNIVGKTASSRVFKRGLKLCHPVGTTGGCSGVPWVFPPRENNNNNAAGCYKIISSSRVLFGGTTTKEIRVYCTLSNLWYIHNRGVVRVKSPQFTGNDIYRLTAPLLCSRPSLHARLKGTVATWLYLGARPFPERGGAAKEP